MRIWLATLALCLTVITPIHADAPDGVFRHTSTVPLDETFQRVYEALEAERFWVVFETDMGSRMQRMRERWGDDYNRNQLTGVRSMVFCNIDWTHRIANADPALLALCPLHLSIYGKDDQSVVVMPRPGIIAAGSAGLPVAQRLEAQLIDIIRAALAAP